jgi:alkylmercury lyase
MILKKTDLSKIASQLNDAGIPPRFEPHQSQLLIKVWRMVAQGVPVSQEQIALLASEINMPLDSATLFLRQISEFDKSGNVVGIFGLSQNKHPHRFQLNGNMLHTWCAWDSLFLPVMINESAKIESKCPVTGEIISITLSPDMVEKIDPTNAVLSIVIPDVKEDSVKVVEEIWMIFCHHVFFFSSPDVANAWLEDKKTNATVLTVEEGFQLGQLTFKELLKFV